MAELFSALALLVGPNPPYLLPSLAMGDARHAWAGTATAIYATSDGGMQWRTVAPAEGSGLVAVDGTHAWALSGNGVTVRTTDGVHWRSLGVQHLLRLSFVSRRDGFALSRDDVVMGTRDGGVSWAPTGGPGRLQSICFGSATTGWVARGGTVWTTADAGVHWRARSLIKAASPDLYCRGHDVWAVFHEGAAAGTEGYDVFASSDGGHTWRERFASPFVRGMPHVSNYSGPVAVLAGGDAVLEGSCGPCEGYGTVTFVHGAVRTTLHKVIPGPFAFADRSHGLALLSPSPPGSLRIYSTSDGGRSWRRVSTLS